MARTLTELLREKSKAFEAETKAAVGIVTEWRDAINALYSQIRVWLGEIDPDHIITIEDRQIELREAGLGKYQVPRLDLKAFDEWVGIIPKARNTVGIAQPPMRSAPVQAIGRVDITDEIRRFILYRFLDDDGKDVWLIDPLKRDEEAKLFDKKEFEYALLSYLL